MKNKRIFVGLDYMAPYFYLTGLSCSFEWLFHRMYHRDDAHEMYAFLNSLYTKDIVYRLPFFNCQFKTYSFKQYLSFQEVYRRTHLFKLKHAIYYMGFQSEFHQYHVAYICARYFDEQLEFLGKVRELLTRVNIDIFSLWFYRSQIYPKPGLIRCLQYQQYCLYGRDECFWLKEPSGISVDVLDALDNSPWHIAESLAFGAYYHAL